MSNEEADAAARAEIARLYERHARAVHAYALRRVGRELADDVTAKVFLVAWRRRARVPHDALPWLYAVARRVLADERRSARRRVALHERLRRVVAAGDAAAARADAGAPPSPDRELAAALARLSPLDREALLLRYWEELSPEQTAAALGCTQATLAVRLHRARTRLRRALATPAAAHDELGGASAESCAAGAEGL